MFPPLHLALSLAQPSHLFRNQRFDIENLGLATFKLTDNGEFRLNDGRLVDKVDGPVWVRLTGVVQEADVPDIVFVPLLSCKFKIHPLQNWQHLYQGQGIAK